MKTETIAIIGLDREGTSVGLALKNVDLDVQILGHDRDHDRAQLALKAGAIDKVHRSLTSIASAADILILLVAATELELTLRTIGSMVKSHALILDLSARKTAGLKWAEAYLQQGHYVSGKLAMATRVLLDGRTGPEAASADHFQGSVLCLMSSSKSDPRAVETAITLGQLLGAEPFLVGIEEYDSLVQGIETMPGLLAAALYSAVHKTAGWRDLQRFADLTFVQTTQPLSRATEIAQVALENKEATLRWLDAFLNELKRVRQWLYDEEEELLSAALSELGQSREQWLQKRAENDWVEVGSTKVDVPSLAQQMFGGLARRSDRGDR